MDPTRWDDDPSLVEVDSVVAALGTDAERGLSSAEAARRLVAVGSNELAAQAPVPSWRKFVAQFQNPLIYLLLGAIGITVVVWVVEGATGVPVDALVIAVIVVVNAVVGYAQESKAEHAVAALARLSATVATVIRDGAPVLLPIREIVPGDVLALAEGDAVSADARLVNASALRVAEASLTGESEPVHKVASTLAAPAALADQLDMVFSGTAVTRGSGRAVVTATGMSTQVGTIAGLLQATPDEPTPLEREIAHVGRVLGIAVVVIGVAVVATLLVASGLHSTQDVVTALLLGVSLAVAAVPEGLPTILAVVLALGVQRMASHQGIVKKLSSVETLGSASVICSDKTGTLTQGEMTVGRIVTASGEATVTGVGYAPEGRVEQAGRQVTEGEDLWSEIAAVLGGGSLANDADLRQVDGAWVVQGDPTEAAFMVAEAKLGIRQRRTDRFERVGVIPFTSERKMMTSVDADAERGGRLEVVTKGAPEVLLTRCTQIRVAGAAVPLDETYRARVLADVERLSAESFRTLGVAYRPLDATELSALDDSLETDLVYAGMVGILDPARPEAAAAIADAHRAGIRIIMITGDHPLTAARIACDLGIGEPSPVAVTGLELDAMDDEGFSDVVRHRSVYARVTPEHKMRIVDALQAAGHVVAMTGDGVNDAPALKSADIGVAMGITGTEVTKEAASMILADDNFATIVTAIREGRGIFSNIKKFLRYLLSSNMGEVLAVFGGVVLAGVIGLTGPDGEPALPLLATQILWINLLTDSAPALAIGVDTPTEDLMARPPRTRSERVIDARMWSGVVIVGLVMALATLATIDLYLPGGVLEGDQSLAVARTAGFTVLVLAQLFNALAARSETVTAFHRLATNRWLWAALALSAALQVAVVNVPFLNAAFGTTPLSWEQWLTCLTIASSAMWASELRKVVLRRADRRRAAREQKPRRGRAAGH